MHSFLVQINEFKKSKYLASWCESLLGNEVFLKPDTATVEGILWNIHTREKKIKEELMQFVRGEITRQDI